MERLFFNRFVHINLPLISTAALVTSFASCRGDGGGEGIGGNSGQNNDSCEAACVADYAEDLEQCGQEASTCLEGCTDLDDTECIWDCEDIESECLLGLTMCTAGCPCQERVQSCFLDCDAEDTSCMTSCSNEYLECAGADSPYTCATLCNATACAWDCEDTAADFTEYLECRSGCVADQVSCVEACA
jgi:hypothetical protein